jgi:YD repeat-containing protein
MYAYDANGNKTSATDANGNITLFYYDGLNRLIKVINPDSTMREISYDPAGNKISETNENGHPILYTYDQLNRLVQKRVVMGISGTNTGNIMAGSPVLTSVSSPSGITVGMAVLGRGLPVGATVIAVSGGTITMSGPALVSVTGSTLTFATLSASTDLITLYQYNGVNSKTQETDPNGNVTNYAYDSIQRMIQITDALSQIWLHDFSGPNTGASAFASSDFKPTQITDPRGIRTVFVYDALYRTLSKSIEYRVIL